MGAQWRAQRLCARSPRYEGRAIGSRQQTEPSPRWRKYRVAARRSQWPSPSPPSAKRRARSSLVGPGRATESRSDCRTHLRKVSDVQSNFGAIDESAAHGDGDFARVSRTTPAGCPDSCAPHARALPGTVSLRSSSWLHLLGVRSLRETRRGAPALVDPARSCRSGLIARRIRSTLRFDGNRGARDGPICPRQQERELHTCKDQVSLPP